MSAVQIDETDPVGELEPQFPYRDVQIQRSGKLKEQYELMDEIGRGKFGTVFRCKEKKSGLILAAKFVGIPRKEDRRSVEREVEIMKSLQHPRLIQLYDAFDDVNRKEMCLVLELIEGGELFERVIDDDFVLTEKTCAIFMRQICEGVEFMHSQSVIHLDMKPENILCLSREGNRIKLIDLGLARVYDREKKLQVLFGTPEFVAPEVVNFEDIGFPTDMWSVGVICYVLLSGLSPFMGDTDVETMANVTIAKYDFDDEAFDDISDEAKDFITQLLVKDPNNRMKAANCLVHPWITRLSPAVLLRNALSAMPAQTALPKTNVPTSPSSIFPTRSPAPTAIVPVTKHPDAKTPPATTTIPDCKPLAAKPPTIPDSKLPPDISPPTPTATPVNKSPVASPQAPIKTPESISPVANPQTPTKIPTVSPQTTIQTPVAVAKPPAVTTPTPTAAVIPATKSPVVIPPTPTATIPATKFPVITPPTPTTTIPATKPPIITPPTPTAIIPATKPPVVPPTTTIPASTDFPNSKLTVGTVNESLSSTVVKMENATPAVPITNGVPTKTKSSPQPSPDLRVAIPPCLSSRWAAPRRSLDVTKDNLKLFVERWSEHPNSPYVFDSPCRTISLCSVGTNPSQMSVNGTSSSPHVSLASSPDSVEEIPLTKAPSDTFSHYTFDSEPSSAGTPNAILNNLADEIRQLSERLMRRQSKTQQDLISSHYTNPLTAFLQQRNVTPVSPPPPLTRNETADSRTESSSCSIHTISSCQTMASETTNNISSNGIVECQSTSSAIIAKSPTIIKNSTSQQLLQVQKEQSKPVLQSPARSPTEATKSQPTPERQEANICQGESKTKILPAAATQPKVIPIKQADPITNGPPVINGNSQTKIIPVQQEAVSQTKTLPISLVDTKKTGNSSLSLLEKQELTKTINGLHDKIEGYYEETPEVTSRLAQQMTRTINELKFHLPPQENSPSTSYRTEKSSFFKQSREGLRELSSLQHSSFRSNSLEEDSASTTSSSDGDADTSLLSILARLNRHMLGEDRKHETPPTTPLSPRWPHVDVGASSRQVFNACHESVKYNFSSNIDDRQSALQFGFSQLQ